MDFILHQGSVIAFVGILRRTPLVVSMDWRPAKKLSRGDDGYVGQQEAWGVVSYERRGGDRSVGLDIGRNGYSSC